MIGDGWIKELDELQRLKELVEDEQFLGKLRRVKADNKQKFATYLENASGIALNCDSIFDVHVGFDVVSLLLFSG